MSRSLYVSLGDSIASGEGVGLRVPPSQTWPRLVADAAGARFVALARGGSPVASVLREQVPLARRLRPDVAFVCVGLNDLFRGAAAPDLLAGDLRLLANVLYADGATVVAARLHDPTRLVRFPAGFARVVVRHVAAVNDALETLHSQSRIELVDLGALDGPGCWSVDRLHPSAFGHRVLAAHAAECLGLPAPIAPRAELVDPTEAQWWRWLIAHGSRWAIRRLPELATSTPLRTHSRAALARCDRRRPSTAAATLRE